MRTDDWGILALYYLSGAGGCLEEPGALYAVNLEEQQTRELVAFVRRASEELQRRKADVPGRLGCIQGRWAPAQVRITRGLRIYIGGVELKARPMTKSVLLLFLRHPEGIRLKCIGDYKDELAAFYRRLSRSGDPAVIERSIERMLDIFSNNVNVNIARVNAAVEALVSDPLPYRISGEKGGVKSVSLDRSHVIWE